MAAKDIGTKVKKIAGDVLARKSIIYGSNFLAGAIGNQCKYEIANPIGAIIFSILDLARESVSDVKRNKYVRLFEGAGVATYGVLTISDLLKILNGKWESLAELPFDFGMFYETGKNMLGDYKLSGSSIGKDLIGIKDDIYKIFNKKVLESEKD